MGLSLTPGAPIIQTAVATLSDQVPNSLSLVQWGTEECTVSQAGLPPSVSVLAWLTGQMQAGPGTIGAGDRGFGEMQISFDGGSNWATLQSQMTATLPITTTSRSYSVARNGHATGTPTGDVQVRAMVADLSQANDTRWINGVITMLVVSA